MKQALSLIIIVFIVSCGQKQQSENSNIELSSNHEVPGLQKVEVTTNNIDDVKGNMQLYERSTVNDPWKMIMNFPVVVGKNGLAYDTTQILSASFNKIKHEGDGCSPAGVFQLSKIFGYHILSNLKMPYEQVDENDLCVDDIQSNYYNTLIDDDTIDAKDYKSFERMKREDVQYEYGVWINYNTDPQIPGRGSCIFLHVWKSDSTGTSGCTAMSKEDMLKLIYWLDEKKDPVLVQYVDHKK
ncbi:MAG: L,D-transpeptidase [Chitinophagales bacterium]